MSDTPQNRAVPQSANSPAPHGKSGKLFYGYILIVVLGFMYFGSSGIILSTASIVNPLMLQDASLGMNATILGTGFSLFVLMQGISAPLIGGIISRIGPRWALTLGAALYLVAMLLLVFFVSSPITYFLVFGVLASFATMMAGQLSVQSTIGYWFVAHRGIAMTIMMVLGASSAFFGPPIVNAIVSACGGAWRSGWYLLIGLGVVMVPVAFFFVRNKPSDLGQYPDGISEERAVAQKAADFKVYKNTGTVTFKETLKSPYFWLIALAATGGFASYTLATSQGSLHFTSLGFDSGLVVAGVAAMGGAMVAGKLLFGIVSDRIEPVRLMVVSTVVIALGVFAGAGAQNEMMVYAFYLCVGLGFGGVNAVFPTAMANYFGAYAFSKNQGTGILVTTAIASTLPILAGSIYDATGYCAPAFYATAVIAIVCAVCGLLVKIPKKTM